MQAFWTLPIRSQLIIVFTILGNTTTQQIEEAVKAIKIRNDIVHKGKKLPAGSKDKLSILLKLVASIVSGPKFKFPKMNIGNAKMSLKEWKKLEKKKLG